LRFLRQVAKAYPRVALHIVVDNYAAHKHVKVAQWLVRKPRVSLPFTPTSASWMNLVEAFFSIITRQAIQRGSFPSVPDLIARSAPSSMAGTNAASRVDQDRRRDTASRQHS
jgi:transposase